MKVYIDLEEAFKDYVEEANEHEDKELTTEEVKRLENFILYCSSTYGNN